MNQMIFLVPCKRIFCNPCKTVIGNDQIPSANITREVLLNSLAVVYNLLNSTIETEVNPHFKIDTGNRITSKDLTISTFIKSEEHLFMCPKPKRQKKWMKCVFRKLLKLSNNISVYANHFQLINVESILSEGQKILCYLNIFMSTNKGWLRQGKKHTSEKSCLEVPERHRVMPTTFVMIENLLESLEIAKSTVQSIHETIRHLKLHRTAKKRKHNKRKRRDKCKRKQRKHKIRGCKRTKSRGKHVHKSQDI